MIFGIGVDISQIKRIWNIYQSHKNFIDYILTLKEIEFFNDLSLKKKMEFLSGRFSAKESYSKAYGTGIGNNIGWKDIEILNNYMGKPIITNHPFKGNAFVSISHTDQLVFTEVILERSGN